ncbi:hypothetical protein D3C71_1652120 [compost metagenome]
MNQLGAGPDHVARVSRLPQLAVDSRADVQTLRVTDLVGGDDAGTKRGRGVEDLATTEFVPSGAVGFAPNLSIARGDVVDDGVAEHMLERPLDRNVASRLADDDRQLCLAVQFASEDGVMDDGVLGADHAIRGLDEKLGLHPRKGR